MKKFSLPILIILILAGCQSNSLEPEFDCALSDLEFTLVIGETECGLATGTITIAPTGGEQPYIFSLNEELGQESPVFDGLGAGEYLIMVVDNLGCSVESTALVSNKNGLSVSATATNSDCLSENGLIIISASNGVEPYSYQLEDNLAQSSAEFIVGSGDHSIIVTDANGCSFNLSKMVNSNTSYSVDVAPIIANSCSVFGCHDGSNSSLPNYTNFSELQANASMVKSRTQSGNMPRTGTLTQDQIDLIACWVDDGAKDN